MNNKKALNPILWISCFFVSGGIEICAQILRLMLGIPEFMRGTYEMGVQPSSQ
ncbi:hypothetical protein N784_10985 [Pontibacillus litoralis JSM 072002]|uniref:Uncharacterized protein n=1 Tax=Pontibacillus litoralis JSM 072002 TaxID=1385512 RepID=A0A0A5G8A4_9BACI|nr:hypothetical protein N784_10985 [Pontibacillus litoralis JSM 072002]